MKNRFQISAVVPAILVLAILLLWLLRYEYPQSILEILGAKRPEPQTQSTPEA
jgi:hypothetical protein